MTEPIIEVRLELTEHGVSNIRIFADSPEARDKGIERLRSVLPQLQLLEFALAESGDIGPGPDKI